MAPVELPGPSVEAANSHRALPLQAEAEGSPDLLALPGLRAFLTSRWYPAAFQAFGLVLLAVVLFFALHGTIRAGRNLGTVITWSLWWPLLPVSLILLGRFWCAVCPLSTGADLVRRIVGTRGLKPGRLLRRYGVWAMIFSFIALSWAERMWNIIGSPLATGVLLLVLLAGAVATSLIFERSVWCRFLCPLGAFIGLYSMTSPLELKTKPGACASCRTQECYVGSEKAAGCPLFEVPRVKESNRNCNLCANCIKACPRDGVVLRLRLPGAELWGRGLPPIGEASLAVLMVAIVYFQSIDMTIPFTYYMKWAIERTFTGSYNVALTLTLAGVLLLVTGSFVAATALSSRLGGVPWAASFARFGVVYVFLAVAAHLGHNVAHLVGEGPAAVKAAAEELGLKVAASGAPLLDNFAMTALSLGLLAAGASGALYATWRIGTGGRTGRMAAALPHLVLVLLFAALYAQMFLLPMNPRHTH